MPWNLTLKLSTGSKFNILPIAASLSLLFFANPGFAQDVSGTALNGSKTLSTGFLPDPFVTSIEPGGNTAVADFGAGCNGYIYAQAPDFELNLDTETAQIGIFVIAPFDTTLVINDPAGNWICNDDNAEAGGSNPGVSLLNPAQGTYDIWVGTYEQIEVGAKGSLMITEYGPSKWASLGGDGATNNSSADTDTSYSNSNSNIEDIVSPEETRCLEDSYVYIAGVEVFQSAVSRADSEFVCGDDDVCRTGGHSSGYYYALGAACDVLKPKFEIAKQSCRNFPDMDNIRYPPICR